MDNHKIFRVIDVSYNRLRDGLRVIEDTLRFVYDSPLYRQVRSLREKLSQQVARSYPSLVVARSVQTDLGRSLSQKKHLDIVSLLRANFSRCSESLRVLEEYYRLLSFKRSQELKKIRFKLYDIEKKVAKTIVLSKQDVK